MNNTITKSLAALFTVVAVVGLTNSVSGQEAQLTQDRTFRADFEVDPLAYALDGHSLHVGFGWDNYRVDLGSFALELPESMHGQEGFEFGFTGFGGKFDVFWEKDQSGAFVGAELGVGRVSVTHASTQITDKSFQLNVGGRVGYRFNLPADFFVAPWVGVSYNPLAKDVTIAGDTYKSSPITVFPTVHLGYRFH